MRAGQAQEVDSCDEEVALDEVIAENLRVPAATSDAPVASVQQSLLVESQVTPQIASFVSAVVNPELTPPITPRDQPQPEEADATTAERSVDQGRGRNLGQSIEPSTSVGPHDTADDLP